jgi:hypothetical protein
MSKTPPPDPHEARNTRLGLLVVLSLIGVGLVVGHFVAKPKQEALLHAVLELPARLRAASAPVQFSTPTSDEALQRLRESTHLVAHHSSMSTRLDGNTTCFEVTVTTPRGEAQLVVQVSDASGAPQATDIGLAPPCACKRNAVLRCD